MHNTTSCDCSVGANLIMRSDDTQEKLRHRYDLYEKETKPLFVFYLEKLESIDASQSPDQVFDIIDKLLLVKNY